ncbi:uncharacterized protein LOC135847759 [Planococcus citri]|uniref:uncharacterized protein LOC135847759 n=1 Tax=Planococcus citri TaxID=170843 RepID=UPI0031F9D396
MNIKIQIFHILFAVWLARVQNGSSEQTMAKSSEELLAYIDLHNSSVVRAVPPYEDFKKIFKSRRDFEKKYCDVVNDMANLHNEIDDMSEENHYLREVTPHSDFLCALDFMTHDLTDIIKNVAGVDYVDHYMPLKEWPFRIQEIRRIYDKFESNRMYQNMRGKGEDPRKADHVAYSKWCEFVTTDRHDLGFTNNAIGVTEYDKWNKVKDKWRSVAGHLHGNLSEYFNNLDPDLRKLRYDNDKRNFSLTFSAIIQRGYRLSCYFEHEKRDRLDAELKSKYPNGTRLCFQIAIERVENHWYFPMEHIDMFNILINATHSDPARKIDHMFAALKIPVEYHDHFIIPGKRGCGKASYVTKRERKYSTKLTPPVETITPSRLNLKKP